MHFIKVNPGGVRREDGVSIQVKHHDYLEYRNQVGMVKISVDYDPETREINVYASQVTDWETLNGSETIPFTERAQIVLDLKDGLALLKGKFVVH